MVILSMITGLFCVYGGKVDAKSKYPYRIIVKNIHTKIGKKVKIKPIVVDKYGNKVKTPKSKFTMNWGYDSYSGGGLCYYNKTKVVIKKLGVDKCFNGPNKYVLSVHMSDKNGKRVAKDVKIKIYAKKIKKHLVKPKLKIIELKVNKKKTISVDYKMVNKKYDFLLQGTQTKYSLNSNFSKAKTLNDRYCEPKIKNAQAGTYYVRIRGYYKYKKKKYYGKWSNVKSIEVPK